MTVAPGPGPRRIFHGWYVVACAFLIAVWGWGLGFYGLGVYLVTLQRVHGWSVASISGAVTTYYLIGAVLITFVGRAMTRFGPVATVMTGVAAMAIGLTALTTITLPWQLYLAFAVMAIGWSAMSAAAINVLVAPWFERRRGMALSLAFNGASVGGIVIGPATLWLVHVLGFEAGLRLAVIAMLVVLCPIVAVVLRRRPDRLGRAPDGGPATGGPATLRASAETHSAEAPATLAPAPRPLRTIAYWTISIPFAAGLAAQVGFLMHQVAFLSPLVGAAAAGACVSATALAAVVGRFVLGGVVDRFDARLAASANFLPQVIGLALLVWQPSGAAVYAGCVLFGLGVGNMVSLPGLLVQREFTTAQFAGVVSLITATNQVAFAFAPTLIGVLRDATGNYSAALGVCIALDIVAAAVVLAGGRWTNDESAVAERRRGCAPTEEVASMLQLRPNCECCDRDLPADSRDAFICSFECTFCRACADGILGGRCPNCGGELVRRPVRPAEKLGQFPASGARVVKPEGCRPVAVTPTRP